MKERVFDVIVIGSGSSGFSAAERANALGAKVCVIEMDAWGGECPNYACVPTKALLKSARAYYEAKMRGTSCGLNSPGVKFNFDAIMNWKEEVVDTITGDGKRLLTVAKDLGITMVHGRAHFLDAHTVAVGSKKYRAHKFVIATGTVDFIPPIKGLNRDLYITYKDAVNLMTLPKSIVVLGGGPVGCEFAVFFAMLGVRVTVLQLAPVLLQREDAEVSKIIGEQFEKLGITTFTDAQTKEVTRVGKRKKVSFSVRRGKTQSVTADVVLVAVGKRANVSDLHLDRAGVHLDDAGRLIVKETLQTSQKHIFAAGDVAGGYLLTNVAHASGYIAGQNVMQKTVGTMMKRDIGVVPRVTFVHPEVASVGMTEKEAIDAGKRVAVGQFPIAALGRAVTEGARVGVVKIVADKKTRKILGGHIVSEHAGEMIHEIALAMHAGLTVDQISSMMHAFPTYSEAVAAAAANV